MPQHILMWVIFAATYLGLALGRWPKFMLDRSGVALVGAVAMLAVGALTLAQAAHFIDIGAILLLFGLMIFSAQLRSAGFQVIVNRRFARLIDRPQWLLGSVIFASALVSALLANDIVCLAFTPLLCELLLSARKNPIPYLLALAMSSNIGSAATVIGNPQNMYIGSVAHLPFGRFTALMIAPAIAGLLLCWGAIALICHRQLHERRPASAAHDLSALRQTESETGIDTYLIGKTLVILAMLVGALIWAGTRSDLRAICALGGGALILCSMRPKSRGLLHEIDWNLLLLFLGLFVVNGAMQQQKLTTDALARVTAMGLNLHQPLPLAGTTLVLSNIVSNVPAVLLLQPPVAAAHDVRLWYLLALIGTWAGNLTLVGSIANLIVAEKAAEHGVKLDLKTYCKVGIPLTLITCVLGVAWIVLMMK